MISREDASYWAIEASRLTRGVTTFVDLEESLVFMSTSQRIRVLTRVVETTSRGEDLLGIMSLLDGEWPFGTQPLEWKSFLPDEFATMAQSFQNTPSGYLAFFRHKVHHLLQLFPVDSYV